MNMHVLPTAATKIDRQDTTPRPIRDVIAAHMEKRAAMLATSDEDLVHHEKTGSDHPVLVEESRALKAVFNAKPRTFREAADLLKYIVCDATGETLNTVYTRFDLARFSKDMVSLAEAGSPATDEAPNDMARQKRRQCPVRGVANR